MSLAAVMATASACSQAARDDRAPAGASVETADAELEAIRTATARFQDLDVALKEGYVRDPMNHCFTAPMEGFPYGQDRALPHRPPARPHSADHPPAVTPGHVEPRL